MNRYKNWVLKKLYKQGYRFIVRGNIGTVATRTLPSKVPMCPNLWDFNMKQYTTSVDVSWIGFDINVGDFINIAHEAELKVKRHV